MNPIHFEGIVLRVLEDTDADDYARAALESVESVGRWMPWCHAAVSEIDAVAWFEVGRRGLEAGTSCEFGVFDEESAEFLGGAGLNAINAVHRFCNLGYWVRRSRQRQGIAVRCVRALARHAFSGLGMRRVEIVVAVGNTASEGVARKAGARLECVARNRLLIGEESVPASVFSLVPGDAGMPV